MRHLRNPSCSRHQVAWAILTIGSALAAPALPAAARVTTIVIDDVKPMALSPGEGIAYEQISGRAFGELDPRDEKNALITDIQLGTSADGKVRYTASFVLTKPVDLARSSGMMWHDVPNRGSPLAINALERAFGDIGLASAWQGDNSAINATNGTAVRATMLVGGRHFVQVPVARNADGSAVTGKVFGRIVNRSGNASQPLVVQTNPVPYLPNTLDTSQAKLVMRSGETTAGGIIDETIVPSSDWAWARCNVSGAPAFPGTPDGTQICLKAGF